MTLNSVDPRPHQLTALSDLSRALTVHDRTQVLMACATGKTLVARWHAEACDAERVVVFVPSLALVAQTLREWRRRGTRDGSAWRFSALVVCSDPTTGAGEAERGVDGEADVDGATWSRMRTRVTTEPAVVARFLKQPTRGGRQVVFSTYHSAPVVAAGQAASGVVFDRMICDEAHRLAGRPRDAFRVPLDSRGMVARKRVFMTATPRVFGGDGGVSMDDPRVFGPVAHTLSFGDAITAGLITDYKVLVVGVREDEMAGKPDRGWIVPAVLMDAIDRHGLRRVLSFHSRVASAARFSETISGARTPAGNRITARHLHSGVPAKDRTRTLRWLDGHGGDQDSAQGRGVRLVSNARCLSEGVDVPGVDGVLFADGRTSVVDIIQIIGRALRPAPGKTCGTIILPVILPAGGDDDSALAASAFGHVWAVLRGLREHDQRLAEEVDAVVRDVSHRGLRAHRRPGRIQFVLPEDVDLSAVQLRMIEEVGSIWERNYALLEEWTSANRRRVLARNAKVRGVSLGEWAEQQRIAYRLGTLPADRVRRLDAVSGWTWDKAEARWDLTCEILRTFADEHGTVADNPTGPSIFQGLKDEDRPQRQLGVWQAVQRQAYRLGTLSERKVRQLAALPGWAWDAHLPADDIAMVEALRVFAEFEKHARVPDDHVEDGLPLGAWCWAVRRRQLNGRLAPALEHEILAATPSKFRAAERFQWEVRETQWRLGYFAMRQFVAREGHARVTGHHREVLPDATVDLGQWAGRQRFLHRHGESEQRHDELLDALKGWQWEVSLQTVEASAPVDLPEGLKHGTAGAFHNYKCGCGPCLEWRRAADRRRLAKRRVPKRPAPAPRARRHLEKFTAKGVTVGTLATVAGVPLGVARKVLAGDVDVIEEEHQLRLLAVTQAMVDRAHTRVGSRGRTTSADHDRIDAGSTWQLLDDLTSRGFGKNWVSRELGYASSLQIRRGTRVLRRIADQVRDLHERVGDLVMPDVPKTVRRPSLQELRNSVSPRGGEAAPARRAAG